jgi:hypothetical protein
MTEALFESSIAPEYEWLRTTIMQLSVSPNGGLRAVMWVDPGAVLGVARTTTGAVEIFIRGGVIDAHNPSVKDALEHSSWTTDDGGTVEANRLVLPSAPHFDQVAAFICAELLKAGIAAQRERAFHETEPVVALAMRRASLSNASLLGFAGELIFLRSLLWTAPPSAAPMILSSWKGSGQSSRDFQFGAVGVEVKTTTRPTSVHHIQGVNQVELGNAVDGEPETSLFLLSLGLKWLDSESGGGYSIPEVAGAILDRLTSHELKVQFVEGMKRYGTESGVGYDHANHARSAHYTHRFAVKWARLYDVVDPHLELLSSEILAGLRHVVAKSVSFQVELPERVSGDINPVAGLGESTSKVLISAGLALSS